MAFPWPHPIYQIERMFGKGKLWEIWQITSNLPNSIPQICYSQTISCTTCNLKCQSWSTFSMCSEAFRWLITRSKWLIVLKIAFLSNTTMWVHQLKGRLLKEGGAILNFDTFTEILSREESIGKRCNFYPMKLFQAFSWSSTKRNFSKAIKEWAPRKCEKPSCWYPYRRCSRVTQQEDWQTATSKRFRWTGKAIC